MCSSRVAHLQSSRDAPSEYRDPLVFKMASYSAVQTFRKKKVRTLPKHISKDTYNLQTATAVTLAREGKGLIKINGSPSTLLQPEILRFKVDIGFVDVG